jgi:hypothetical protein
MSAQARVGQADIDEGKREGVPSEFAAEIRRLEKQVWEVKRFHRIQNRAADFFGAELCRRHNRLPVDVRSHRGMVSENRSK